MTKPKIISWDLDETLGFFRDIVSARSGHRHPDPEDAYSLRKDIIRTLNQLVNKSYRHVVTSSAKLDYSEKVLQAVCLDAYFDHVFGRDKVTDGIWGKKYLPVAELYQLDELEARSHMLVIANMASDEPIDLDIVFIHDQRGLEESALVYETIAETLWTRGEGSFRRGFEAFFETGKRISCLDKDFDFMLVSATITDEVAVDMGYKNSPRTEGLKVPVVLNIRSA
ncbi:MAG: hypothetical protein JSV16_00965 [Candidatus Hydrogenedentota bacterium]|nr:MAG: hypothetical protein JSV16_00965 [Candidatus Hydrogenedentota bacterium]